MANEVQIQGKRFQTPNSGYALQQPQSKVVIINSNNSALAGGAAVAVVVPLGTFVLPNNGLIKRISFTGDYATVAAPTAKICALTTFSLTGVNPFYQPAVSSLFSQGNFLWEKSDNEGTSQIDLITGNLFIPANVTITLSSLVYRTFALNDVAFSSVFLTIELL
jgi:hypothetical protein